MAQRTIGTVLDSDNLLWAIRYRVYHHLSEEEIINYTLPIGYEITDHDIRTIARGGRIADVVFDVYPELADAKMLGSRFVSTNPMQDSLQFYANKATYERKDNIIWKFEHNKIKTESKLELLILNLIRLKK